MALNIDNIIADAQRRVKKESEKDREEFSNHLKDNSNHWLNDWLANPIEPSDLVAAPKPITVIQRAKKDMNRRLTHEDFRERFSDTLVEKTRPERQGWFEEMVSSTLRTYTKCYNMVD